MSAVTISSILEQYRNRITSQKLAHFKTTLKFIGCEYKHKVYLCFNGHSFKKLEVLWRYKPVAKDCST